MKNKNIQALRGICAIIVYFSHSLHVYDSTFVSFLHNSFLHLFFDGEIAVCFFFVLSGFFYYNEDTISFDKYRTVILKKTKKIFPPHWVFLTIAFAISTLYQEYDLFNDIGTSEWFSCFWKQPISFIDYLRGCSVILKPDTHLLNPPVWYLEAEVSMFIIMPIMVALFNKYGWSLSILIVLLCVFVKIPLIPWVGAYLWGAYVKKNSKIIIKFIDANTFSLFFFVIIGLILLNVENELYVHNNMTTMISCLGASIYIVILYYKKIKLFEMHFFQFLGNISYEFYLCHFIVLLALKPLFSNVCIYIASSIIISFFLSYNVKRLLHRILL